MTVETVRAIADKEVQRQMAFLRTMYEIQTIDDTPTEVARLSYVRNSRGLLTINYLNQHDEHGRVVQKLVAFHVEDAMIIDSDADIMDQGDTTAILEVVAADQDLLIQITGIDDTMINWNIVLEPFVR